MHTNQHGPELTGVPASPRLIWQVTEQGTCATPNAFPGIRNWKPAQARRYWSSFPPLHELHPIRTDVVAEPQRTLQTERAGS